MAHEYTIEKIINPEDLLRIKEAENSFNNTAIAYGKLAAKMAGGLKLNPSDLEAMDKKQKEYTASLQELYLAQNKLSDLQKEYDKLLKNVAEQTKENVKQILEEAKANKLNTDAQLTAQKAKTEQLKQEKLLNQTKKQTKVTIEEGVAALNMEVKSLRDAEEQNRLLRASKKDIDLTTKEGRDTMQKFNTVIDKNTALIKKNSDSLVKSKMNVGRYKEDIKSATSEIIKGNISIKNMGDLVKSTGGYIKSGMGSGLSEVRIGVGSMIKGMVGAQAIIGLFQKAIGLIKSGVDSIINFEAANSKLSAVLGVTSSGMKELIADAKRLGAATKYTASEATNLQIELAKLGFTKKEILESTESILKFAQATGAELPEAAALAGASIRMFGASTKETERYVSAMAVATTKSALSFSYLQTAMPIVGPVAKSFNFQIEDTLALLGKLSDAGFDASMAATATRNILLNLADGNGKLAKALGNPVKTLPELVDGLNKLKAEGIDLNKTLELTDKRSVAAFNAFITAANGIVPLRNQITGVAGELGEMADKMGDNVAGAILGLSSAWEALMLTFSNSTGPAKSAIDFLSTGLRNIANQWKPLEERENSAIQSAVKNQRELSSEFKIEERYIREIKDAWEEYMDSGIESKEAFRKAVDDKKKYLNGEITKYGDVADKAEQSYRRVTDAMLNSNMFTRAQSGTSKSDYNKKRGAEFGLWTEAEKESEKYKYVLENVEAYEKDFFERENKNRNASTLTDEEIKAQEKAAKERLRIRKAYQQSELDLMDEGLDKEIAKISLNYSKKMAAIKGNSNEEVKTRENLAKEMQNAINDKATSYVTAKEQKDIANKLDAIKKGSKEELDLKIEQLELQRDIEITEAIKTGEDLALIDEKYNAKRKELDEKFADEQNQVLQKGYAGRSVIVMQEMENELSALTNSYSQGIIDKETYEEEKLRITEKYAIEQAQLAIDLAKAQLLTADLSPDDRLDLEKKLAEAEIALAEKVRDAQVKAAEDTAKSHEEKMKKIADGLQMAGEFLNAFADLGSAIYERKIEEAEGEQEKNQETGEAEQERIDRLAESGAITTEEAEARKRAAAAKTSEKDKELAKKKADLQTKQAKMDKANAIVQSIINTAIAVMKVWGQTGIGGFALAPVVAALGAIQLATIIAQPIPKYAKGTDNHPGGLAVVGDGGKQEMIVSNGKSWITPSVPTLVDIPKGAVVLPDVMDMDSIRGMKSDVMLLLNEAARKGDPVTVNVNNDYRKLEGGIDRLNSSFSRMAKYQRKAAVQADLRNVASRL